MNTFVLAFCAALAVAHAGVIEYAALPSAKVIQGPSSRSTIVGNDGSVISSVAPGGSIVTDEHDGVVAHVGPAVVAHTVPVATVAHAAPVLAHTGPAVVSPVAAVAHTAPVVGADIVIAGPSGTVVSGKSHFVAPTVVAHAVHAAPVVAADTVVAGPSGTVVSGRSHLVAPVVAHHSVW